MRAIGQPHNAAKPAAHIVCGGCLAHDQAITSQSIDVAERRPLTVMFCELVGSTALSARLDPDNLRAVIGAYRKCVVETVAGFDGFVAIYREDGLLIYSAIPRPHGDDAERAVRTELDGRRALQRFGRSIADQALSFGNTMVSKGSAGRRLTPDPKVIA